MPLIFGSVEIKAHNLLYIMLRGFFSQKNPLVVAGHS